MCVTLLIGWCIWTCSVSVRDCLSTLSWNVRCLFSVWLWIFFFSFHQSYGIAKSSGQPLWLPLMNQQLSVIYFFLYLVSLTVLSVSDIQITHEMWETLDTVYLTVYLPQGMKSDLYHNLRNLLLRFFYESLKNLLDNEELISFMTIIFVIWVSCF